MTQLGKQLVFSLKYQAEMDRLYYGDEEPDLTGLDNAEQVREMVSTVGDAACNQVADFLELCGKGIENHFTGLGIATLTKKSSRAYMVNNWQVDVRLSVPSVPGGWVHCGVFITAPSDVSISFEKDVCGLVVPWLWSKGGHKGADKIWNILGGWAHSRGEGMDTDTGTVVLACIPIMPQPPESFDVDRDPLIAEVMKTITRIGVEETKAIAKIGAGSKEPDES